MKVLMIFSGLVSNEGIGNNVINYFKHIDKTDLQIEFIVQNQPQEWMINEIINNNSKYYVLNGRKTNTLKYIILIRNGLLICFLSSTVILLRKLLRIITLFRRQLSE